MMSPNTRPGSSRDSGTNQPTHAGLLPPPRPAPSRPSPARPAASPASASPARQSGPTYDETQTAWTYSPIPLFTYTHPHATHTQPPSTHTFPHTHFHTWPSSDICTTPFPFPFHQRLPTRSHRRFPAQTYGQVTPRGVRVNARSWPLNEPSSLCVCRVPKRRHQRPAFRPDFSHSDVRFWGCAPRGEKERGRGPSCGA